MSIADELALLANTKENLRLSLGLSKDVPFSQYASRLPFYAKYGTVFDFVKNQYSKDQLPVDLSDISEFIRLSSATEWQNGKLVEVADNVPRISGEGLLIEPQRTNEVMQDFLPETPMTVRGITTTVIPSPMGGDSLLLNVDYRHDEGYKSYTADIYKNWTSITNLPTGTAFATSLYVLPVQVNSRYPVVPPDGAPVMDRDVFLQIISDDSHNLVTLKGETGGAWGRVEHRGPRRSGNCHISLGNRESMPSFDPAPSGDEKVGVWGLQCEVQEGATSYIPTHGTPATRAPDILNIPLLSTQTITGDWDAGVTYSVAGGIATFSGHGYIRNIAVEAL